jgi:hypothetical protein
MKNFIMGVFTIGVILWCAFIVLVVLIKVFEVIKDFIAGLFRSVFDTSAPQQLSAPSPVQNQSRPRVIQLGAKPDVSPPVAPVQSLPIAPLELSVEQVDVHGPQSRLEIKVRGGEPDAGNGAITYVISAKTKINGQSFVLGDGRSIKEIPGPFSKSYVLKIPKPLNGRWVVLAAPLVDEFLPPFGGVSTYEFKCEVFKTGGPSFVGQASPYGLYLEKAECSAEVNLPSPGYIDEIKWLHVRQGAVRLMAGLVRACVVNVDQKRSALYAWMNSMTPLARHGNRRDELKARLLTTHSDFDRPMVLDLGALCEVRDTRDDELMESIARLMLEVVGKEPGGSEPRRAYSTMRDLFNVYLDGKHITILWPEAPLQVQAPVVPVVQPKPAFAIMVVPYAEQDLVKGVEVFVRGAVADGSVDARRLIFWAWDKAQDQPLLVACPDIDLVHERAMHQRAWAAGQYDPDKWQSAGFIWFNAALPPHGGLRSLVIAGRLTEFDSRAAVKADVTVRSEPVSMKIGSLGYLKIRDNRFQLRRQALVLAFGLALISGKVVTFMQEKNLQLFANHLCADIKERDYAEACKGFFRKLLESTTVTDVAHLQRLLGNFATSAPDDLKIQLYQAFVKIMAARKVRTKESRDMLALAEALLDV